MRQILIAVWLVVAAVSTAQAQTFDLGQPLTVEWAGAVNEAAAGVDVYQVRIDAGAWTASGQTVPQTTYRYAIPQALLTLGDHTASVRACAGTVCGAELSVAFAITRPLPGLPRNPRILPTPSIAVLTIPQALDRAHAYALLILDRPLTGPELDTLVTRHGAVPPTRESVLRVLDASFAEFVSR